MMAYAWVGSSYLIDASISSYTVWENLDMSFFLFYETFQTQKYGFQFKCIYMSLFLARNQGSYVDIASHEAPNQHLTDQCI